MKYKVLFSLKNNDKVFMNVVCCSCDWRFRVYNGYSGQKSVWHLRVVVPVLLFCSVIFFLKESLIPCSFGFR